MVDPLLLLTEAPFERRLAAFLEALRERASLAGIALIELTLRGGSLRPIIRGSSRADLDAEALFRALVERAGKSPAPIDGLFGGEPISALMLPVRPALAVGGDVLLLLAGGSAVEGSWIEGLTEALSEDRKRTLARYLLDAVDRAPDAMELTDRSGRLLYVNEAWERFSGYSSAEALGRTVGSLFREPSEPLHDAAFYQFTMSRLLRGESWTGLLACRTASGERAFREVVVSPFLSGDAEGHFAVRRDLAHRRERDEALAVTHSEFRSVLAALPDGAVVLRDDLVYFANHAFLAMVRRDESTVIGRPYLDLVFPEDRPLLAGAHGDEIVRVRMVASDGSLRIAEISTAGALSFEGRPAVILLSRDTTETHLAREQLARAEKLSALGSLAAGVAHEINNPLGYVSLNLAVLEQGGQDLVAPASDALREAVDGIRRIQGIVSELRALSGTETPGPPEPVSVAQALTSALNIAHNEIRHRARLEREGDSGLLVMAREGPLVQVLLNILVNAAQAIPERGEHVISVRSSRSADGMVEIAVTDTGVGIPDELMPKLFQPFTSTKRRGQGSGLGLAICKRIVDSFGGKLSIQSAVGCGTTVFVRLPSAGPPARAPRSIPITTISTTPRRLLVVDDETPIVRALRRALSEHDLVSAADGPSALQILLDPEQRFDAILCDLMMPGLSGPEIYQAAIAARPELAQRFLFMTGGAFTESGRAFLDTLGARALIKPFDVPTLLQRLESIFARAERADTRR